MLFTVAIVKRPTCDEAAAGENEEVIYGPVNIITRDGAYDAIANKVIADAALAGKLPSGWQDTMYVCGVPFQHFT
jgi:hypothetical protein